MRTLVVYYSLTGHTRHVAERIADRCNADTEEIKDLNSRTGAWAMLSSGREALLRRPASIQPTRIDPGRYDLVVLGTPIWAWTMSSPMRAYIIQHAARLNRVAFFCTEGGIGGERAFAHMSALVGARPVATLEVTESDLKTGAEEDKLQRFIAAIAGTSGVASQARSAAG
jgi:flavodoxin